MSNASAGAARILKESCAIDSLFHGLFTDPPFECGPDHSIVDILLEGGVTAISTTIVDDNYPCNFTECCKAIHQYYLLEETLPEKVIVATSAADILRAKAEGKLAVIMSTQGAFCFEQDLRYISLLNRLGLKIVQLTYNQQSFIGSGAFVSDDTGLSRFGEQCIYEMNRVGMLIDLSHAGRKTSLDAIAAQFPSDLPDLPTIRQEIDRLEKEEAEAKKSIEEIRRRFGKRAVFQACLLGDLKMPIDNRHLVQMPGVVGR